MTLELDLKNKIITLFLLIFYPFAALADPEVNGELIPPGEAMHVTDPAILSMLNLDLPNEPVWCYSNLANSIIITSADREREKCKLKLKQELQKAKADCDFLVEQLNISIRSLNEKHEKLISLKNKQIESLTASAIKRPNDYSFWWASGGVVVGVVSTLAIILAVK